jgi:alpha-beta hydrolase superfamily lysophospholipase
VDIPEETLTILRQKPFFIVGASLGGALSTMATLQLQSLPPFKGAILLAPALDAHVPHWLLVNTLRYTVALFNPSGEILICCNVFI